MAIYGSPAVSIYETDGGAGWIHLVAIAFPAKNNVSLSIVLSYLCHCSSSKMPRRHTFGVFGTGTDKIEERMSITRFQYLAMMGHNHIIWAKSAFVQSYLVQFGAGMRCIACNCVGVRYD